MAVTPTDASTINPLFVNTDYIGAIDPDCHGGNDLRVGLDSAGTQFLLAPAQPIARLVQQSASETPQSINAARTEVNVCVIDTHRLPVMCV